MAIECYYNTCFFHGENQSPYNEGPFCYEEECRASQEQLILFGKYHASKDPKRPTPASNAQ